MSSSGPTLVATPAMMADSKGTSSNSIVSTIHSALASLAATPRSSNTPRSSHTPRQAGTPSSLSNKYGHGHSHTVPDSGRILPSTTSIPTQQCSIDSSTSSTSSNSIWPEGTDEEEDEVEGDPFPRSDAYERQNRSTMAKEAARILLAQFMQDDDEYEVFPRLSPSLSRTTRLGLAPMTLLLNPETPCPTKIIPLPDTSSASSAYSLDDDDGPSSSSEEEQEAQDVQEAQAASLFIRLL